MTDVMTVRSVPSSLRVGFGNFGEAMGRFTLANLFWLAAAGLTSFAGRLYLPAYAVGVILIPVSCGLLRMACHAARGNTVRIRQFRRGMSHRLWVHLALGVVQVLILGVSAVNLGVGLSDPGLFLAAVAVVSAYVALGVGMVATAAWPLLLDPYRSTMSWRDVLRLAVTVLLRRPIGLAVLTILTAALIAFTAQTILLALFLPAYGSLVAAHYVLPIADELQGGPPDLRDEGSPSDAPVPPADPPDS